MKFPHLRNYKKGYDIAFHSGHNITERSKDTKSCSKEFYHNNYRGYFEGNLLQITLDTFFG